MGLLGALLTPDVDRPDAVRIADRQLSREDLHGYATAVADEIQGAGVVAVDATPTVETVVGVLAGIIAGIPVVPIPAGRDVVERRHILRDSGASLLLSARDTADGLDAGRAGAGGPGADPVRLPIRMGRRSGSSYPEPPVDRPALILYTGGTSGPPKGVRVSRAAIATDLDAVADAWQWTADDVLVHGLPLFGVHGLVLGVLGPLRIGGRLVHTGEPRPEAYAAAAGSLYFGVPEVWSRICADTRSARALRPARLLVSGGATLPIPVFGQLAALTGHRPVERYGTTETLITTSGCARGDRRPGYVGRALSGVQTRLVDESGSALPADDRAVGELQVRGPMLFGGYHNRPLATAESFAPGGWFRTGDLATMSPDGWHRIVGRSATDLIVCDGYRIGAGEVEIALRSHPAVRDATVLGTPHPRLGQQVTAYVVADGVTAQELVDFVARVLPAHKRPRRVHLAETLPGTTLGRWRSAC